MAIADAIVGEGDSSLWTGDMPTVPWGLLLHGTFFLILARSRSDRFASNSQS
jgi:hypothetical protein